MKKKILIVDDEPSIVLSLEFILEQNGYFVQTATSGEEALETILKFEPDLVLLDIMLPGIDGFEVCQIIRLNPEYKNPKIIFLTALGREEDIAKGMILGADAYLTKPFSNAEILAKTRKLIGIPAAQKSV